MIGIFYLLLFYCLGEGISQLAGNFIPGSIIGMLLLFFALNFKVIRKEDIKDASNFLLDNLMLFFIPVCVGLMTAWTLISQHWLPILVSCVVSTLLIIVTVGHLQQYFEKKGKRKHPKN